MVASAQGFKISLYEEHLDELSSLYEQLCGYREDSELSWLELGEWEKRFEAHLAALTRGGELAIKVCMRRAGTGDFGERHAAMRIFCRQDRADLAYALLQGIDAADALQAAAVGDALNAECPEHWFEDLMRVMSGRCTELIPILAGMLGYRRVAAEDVLINSLQACPEAGLQCVLWALGRVGSDRATRVLDDYLHGDDPVLAESACRALMRLGDANAVRHGLLAAQIKSWPIHGLAIGGNSAATKVLRDIAKTDAVSDDMLTALGMLGDLGAVSTVFACLSDSKHAVAAATALQTITGARIYEEVFVPEDLDPEELFDEEREAYEQTGAVPMRPDGEPFGATVSQICVNPETWRAWLTEHKSEFDPQLRYRHGKPYGPAALVESLAAEHTPNRVRALICDELVVRYQAPVQLETDMPVREQLRHLAELARWAQANQGKFKPGVWYFAGRPMD